MSALSSSIPIPMVSRLGIPSAVFSTFTIPAVSISPNAVPFHWTDPEPSPMSRRMGPGPVHRRVGNAVGRIRADSSLISIWVSKRAAVICDAPRTGP